jgi:ssRNA-specific RNase YbeY (16S rRNA maturation enzyme)
MRLRFGERWAATREVHGGSGYWSQDGATQVLALPASPDRIEVKWPGGKTTTDAVPPGAREIVVSYQKVRAD